MFEEIETVKELHQKGKLDKRLRIRLIWLSTLTLIFGGIGLYNLLVHDLDLFWVIVIIIIGFCFGMFVLSHMYKIKWDESNEVMTVSKLDGVGVIVLALYVSVRAGTKWFLGYFSHNTVVISSLVIASIFGIMLGRLVGTLVAMHTIHNGKG